MNPNLLLAPGDLLFNRTNSRELVGKVGLVKSVAQPTTFASYLVRLRANSAADPAYLNYLLNTGEILSLARSLALPSIGQANLNPSRYSEIRVPVPPLEEQKALAQELQSAEAKTNRVKAMLAHQTSLLRERRQALITIVVNGQLSIPVSV